MKKFGLNVVVNTLKMRRSKVIFRRIFVIKVRNKLSIHK